MIWNSRSMVINTPTLEAYNYVKNLVNKIPTPETSCKYKIYDHFETYRSQTCLQITETEGYFYSPISFYKEEGFIIIPFKDFKEESDKRDFWDLFEYFNSSDYKTKNINNDLKIKQKYKNIDPFLEEDWDDLYESSDKVTKFCVRINGELDFIKAVKFFKENNIQWAGGKDADSVKYNRNIDWIYYNLFKDNYTLHHADSGAPLGRMPVYSVDELNKVDFKKYKRIENKSMDPYNEEDWGFVEESIFNLKSYTLNDILEKQKKYIGKTLKVYPYAGEPFTIVMKDIYIRNNELWIELDDGEKMPMACITSDSTVTMIVKNNNTNNNNDNDPYGEEMWDEKEIDLWEYEKGFESKLNKKYPSVNERKIDYKKRLCPKLFEGDKLKTNIREKLYKIGMDFYEDLDIEVELIDIWLTGSIANYNYNSYSDIDIHLIVDYSEVNDDIELVEKAFDGDRYIWNLRHNIVIQGHDVEIYVQDIKSEHASSGVYSIMNDDWVKKPSYRRPTMDQKDVDEKYDVRVRDIEEFVTLSKEDLDPEEAELYYKAAKKLKKRIQKERTDGLKIIGEFSLENLVFKKLRKTGKFGKLINAIARLYDQIYSQ